MKLTDYQEEAFEILKRKNRVYLNWDVGVGKTFFFVFASIERWREVGRCLPTLAVCPQNVFSSFIETFHKIGIDRRYYEILDSPSKRERFFRFHQFKPFTVMSYDTFKSDKFMKAPRDWYASKTPISGAISHLKPEILILDEAHQVKNSKAIVGKKARMIINVPSIKWKMFGSGTPIAIDGRDLFNQFFALDAGKTFGVDEMSFINDYFYDVNQERRGTKGYFPKYEAKSTNELSLFKKAGEVFHIKKAKDCVKLPELKEETVWVDMTEEQETVYKKVELLAHLEFETKQKEYMEGKITKSQFYQSALSKLSALRQVCCGFVYEKDYESEATREVMEVETNKMNTLEKALDFIPFNEKLIIWTVYLETFHQIERLLRSKGIRYATVNGKLTSKQKQQNIKLYKENPSIRVLVAHPKSGGSGLNLQIAKYCIYYSQDFSYIDKVQSEGRNFRKGSIELHDQVQRIYIKTKDSVEENISMNLKRKGDFVASFQKYLTARKNLL